MKTKQLLTKMLLVAVGMLAGSNAAWGVTNNGTVTGYVGSVDNTSGYDVKGNKKLMLAAGDRYVITFVNYNKGDSGTDYWENWAFRSDQFTCRGDHGESNPYGKGANTNNVSYEGDSWSEIYSSATQWLRAYNGVTVTLTVARDAAGTGISVAHSATTNAVDAIASRTYAGTFTADVLVTDVIEFYLTCEDSHLLITNVTKENGDSHTIYTRSAHTAGAKWGSGYDGTYASTVDAAEEFYNTTTSDWKGAAYSKFTYDIPADATVTSATLTYNTNQGGSRTRTDNIYYMSKGFDLDWDNFAGQKNVDLANSSSRNLVVDKLSTGGTGVRQNLSGDVTTAVQMLYTSGQRNYILFQWCENAGAANLYGNGATDYNAPQLEINYTTASLYDYTINYKVGGEGDNVKTTADSALEGAEINAETSFWVGDVKYVINGDQTTSMIISSGTNVLNINVKEETKYTCTVNLKAGDVLLATESATVYKGESTTVYYHKAYEKDGKWYFIAANGSSPGYGVAFSAVDGIKTENITTYGIYDSVVYFAETENLTLSGNWAADGNYLNWRSNGGAKRLAKKSYIYTSTITPGVYNVTLWARNNRSAGDGTETLPLYLRDEDGNLTDLNVSFPGWNRGGYEAEKTNEITIPDDGKNYSVVINNNTDYSSNLEMDYVYLTLVRPLSAPATVTSAGWATLYTPYALDFSDVDGLTAYTASVSENTVTLTEVTNVPANTGVVLKGAENTYSIPVIASSSTEKGDLKGSATEATACPAASGTYYILTMNGANAEFNPATSGEIAAGKAYLHVGGSSRSLSIVFSDATGISSMQHECTLQNEVYNLNGQRVAQPRKGLYIVNGKKTVIR